MITERTLKRWRRDALQMVKDGPVEGTMDAAITYNSKNQLCKRILRMTQELMDLHLTKYERGKR